MKEKTYACEVCGKTTRAGTGDALPDCCDRPMQLKLENCTKPFAAETARPWAADEPCDDGTDSADKK